MRVLFVFPLEEKKFYVGVGILSAILKQHGHKTALLMEEIGTSDMPQEILQKIKDKIKEFKADFVAMPSYDATAELSKQTTRFIKKEFPHMPIVVGGYWAMLSPEDIIAEESIDYVCVGEGEEAMLELVEAVEAGKSPEKIKNIWMKKDGKVVSNPCRPLVEDLDTFPFPDREIFDYQKIIDSYATSGYMASGFAAFMAGRGCPYNCTYCSNHRFRELYPNKEKYTRMRSVDNLLAEIEEVGKKYHFGMLNFLDDTFVIFRPWLEEFCEKYKKRFSYPWVCNARVNHCPPEVLKMMKEAHCERLQIGIESGDPWLRENILSRHMTNQQIIQVFDTARKLGIETYSYNILGLPYETRWKMLKTILLNLRILPNHIQVSIYYPFKNTQLGDLCFEKGLVDLNAKANTMTYFGESALKHPNLTKTEITLAQKFLKGAIKVTKVGRRAFGRQH